MFTNHPRPINGLAARGVEGMDDTKNRPLSEEEFAAFCEAVTRGLPLGPQECPCHSAFVRVRGLSTVGGHLNCVIAVDSALPWILGQPNELRGSERLFV